MCSFVMLMLVLYLIVMVVFGGVCWSVLLMCLFFCCEICRFECIMFVVVMEFMG